jgi:hypothetical protein
MKNSSALITPSAFARLLNVNRSTISRAIAAGRLQISADGLIDPEQALADWQRSKHGGRPDVAARIDANRRPVVPAACANMAISATAADDAIAEQENAASGAHDQSEAPPGTMQAFRIAKLVAENASLTIAMELATHARYPRDRVLNEAQAIGSALRAQLERLVDQLAAPIAAHHGADDRQRLIATECARLRRAARATFPAALRRLRQTSTTKESAS